MLEFTTVVKAIAAEIEACIRNTLRAGVGG
jgi:hypothetical protein